MISEKEYALLQRLYDEERRRADLTEAALVACSEHLAEARRSAEEWRDYAKAWRVSAYGASFMKKPAELPWEGGR